MNISLVYSGGVQNTSQNNSLGGFPSPVAVTDDKNNLFNDITPQQTTQGVTDFKCIYIFNDDINFKYDITLFVEYLDEVGATVELGFLQQNAVQSLRFPQIPTGGTFTITIQGIKTPTITWVNDVATMQAAIQTAIQKVTNCLVDVASSGQFFYNITFMGIMGNKSLATLSVTDNNLTPYETIIPIIQHIKIGSPINTVAPETIGTVIPTGVPFASALFPGVTIGTLFPSEGFPLWIRRSIAPGFEPVEGDGFKLHTRATTNLS